MNDEKINIPLDNPFPEMPDLNDHYDKRLWLAGMAMQAMLAKGNTDAYQIAHQSYQMADVMLEVEESAFVG
jgi:hypothetical protein